MVLRQSSGFTLIFIVIEKSFEDKQSTTGSGNILCNASVLQNSFYYFIVPIIQKGITHFRKTFKYSHFLDIIDI